ncbi:MOSC domain containing protein [Candidatus Sulfopaludibacter sp. SbA6]|nr:MOSC domain containing protein [Candidatus Sulfopaludibacter sp. SbA6]
MPLAKPLANARGSDQSRDREGAVASPSTEFAPERVCATGMEGTIVQVNISLGGLPKRAIAVGFVNSLGIEGDRHAHPEFHGGERQAILLIASEVIDGLTARGYPLFYGALGENLTTRGIDVRDLRIGDQIRAGGALIEITQPRGPCMQLDIYGGSLKYDIYDQRVKERDHTSPHWGMSGFYASVVSPGPVGPGDIITVVAKLA